MKGVAMRVTVAGRFAGKVQEIKYENVWKCTVTDGVLRVFFHEVREEERGRRVEVVDAYNMGCWETYTLVKDAE